MSALEKQDLSRRLPTEAEEESARQAASVLARSIVGEGVISLCVRDGKDVVELPKALGNLLLDLLGHVGNGEAVTLVPRGSQLSTQQAADILNVSRPFLIKLIEDGELQCFKVGTHRRLEASEVFAYRELRERERSDALDELIRLRQEMEAS
jgi:excisionase family DNA binding protein